eukprot:4469303-Amphidinium_carterae.1
MPCFLIEVKVRLNVSSHQLANIRVHTRNSVCIFNVDAQYAQDNNGAPHMNADEVQRATYNPRTHRTPQTPMN